MSTPRVTQLLERWSHGDPDALNELTPLIEDELRKLAAGYLRRERPHHTLQATALVDEAYVRLLSGEPPDPRGRTYFFGVAARQMRRILVDHARRKHAEKRGGGVDRITYNDEIHGRAASDVDILSLHRALEELEELDPRQARVVELRFFAGRSIPETAQALDISPATVKREWATAKVWLRKRLKAAERESD